MFVSLVEMLLALLVMFPVLVAISVVLVDMLVVLLVISVALVDMSVVLVETWVVRFAKSFCRSVETFAVAECVDGMAPSLVLHPAMPVKVSRANAKCFMLGS